MVHAKLSLKKDLIGPILDLGGGGEGVIGRIYGQQAVAIDNRQEELDEAPDGPKKLLMDASALAFAPGEFSHVTAFFSLMYMPSDIQGQVIAEAARVLCPGGCLHIWDTDIDSAFPNPFLVELDLDAAGQPVHTCYGIIQEDAFQDADRFIRLAQAARLRLAAHQRHSGCFYLRFVK